MAAYSQPYYRALLIPDWRIDGASVWTAQSSYTQAGPHPGTPEPTQATRMTLEASGEYEGTAASISLRVTKPGHASRTGAGANVIFLPSGETLWRGWDRPSTVVGQELLDTGATYDEQSRGPHLATTSTGAVICAYHELEESGTAAVYYVRTRTRAASTGTWAAAVTAYTGTSDWGQAVAASISNHAGPCLLALPGGRVLLFVTHEDVAANTATVRMFYSDDDGATWVLGSPTCLPASVATNTYTIRRLRAAYLDGQILLLLWRFDPSSGPSDVLLQYASDDLGGSFRQVSSTTNAGLPDVVATEGRLVVAYVPRSGESKAGDPCWSVLGSAWSPLDEEYAATLGTRIGTADAATFDGNSNISQSAKLCLCADERGILYAYWGDTDLYGAMQDGTLAATSGTWEPLGTSSGQPIFDLAASDYLREAACTFQRGRVLLAASNTASTATTDDYLAVWYLGGYTTTELPASELAIPWWIASSGSFANIPATWIPIELPQNTGWTAAGTASSETIGTSGTSWSLNVQTAANTRYYSIAPTASTAGVMATWVAKAISGTSTEMQVTLIASGGGAGADDYQLHVYMDQAAISMYDGATLRQSDTTAIGSGWVQFLAAANSGKASVWYRAYDADEEREWIALGTGETLTAQSLGTANLAQFGTNTANGTYQVEYLYFCHISGAPVGNSLAAGQTNPNDLAGRPIGSAPMYLHNGVWVRATGGPAIGTGAAGDGWTIAPRYDYGVENLDPRISPSPRDAWRSTQVASDEYVAWQIDADGDARLPTDLVGVHLERVTYPNWVLQYYDGATWQNAASFSGALEVAWTREAGSVMITYASGGSSPWSGVVREDEWVDGSFQFDASSTSSDVRKITRNTGGTVQSGGSPRVPRLYCADVDNTEGASGTGYIWPPRISAVATLAATAYAQGLRLYADRAGTFAAPPEGYFGVGACVVGSVYLLGFDPDLGRTRTRGANVDVAASIDGRKRSRVRGPSRRRLSLSWEGVPTGELYGLADRHVQSGGTGTPVVALRHEVPNLLDGLYDHLDGGNVPIVYLPNVSGTTVATGGAVQTITQGQLYGRIEGEITLQTLPGRGRNEDDDEVIAVSLDIVEEV